MEDNYTKLTKKVAKWMIDACEEQLIEESNVNNPSFSEEKIKEAGNDLAYSLAGSDHFWNSVCDAITAESGEKTKEVTEETLYKEYDRIAEEIHQQEVGGEG